MQFNFVLAVTCPVLIVANGDLFSSSSPNEDGSYNFETEIIVICDKGYDLGQTGDVVCTGEGQWSSTPLCIRMYRTVVYAYNSKIFSLSSLHIKYKCIICSLR